MQKVKVSRKQVRAERRTWRMLNGVVDDRPVIRRTNSIIWDEIKDYEEPVDKGGSKKKGGKTKWPNTKTIK